MPRRHREKPDTEISTANPEPVGAPMAPIEALVTREHDRALRPRRMGDFTGQRKVVGNLGIAISAAIARKEPLDHVLLSGPPGLGKTTLAAILAAEMGVEMRETAATLLDKPGDLASVLSGLLPNQVLFIDEIHALKRQVEEYLYSAMEDYKISIHLGEGAAAQTLTVPLNPFTLIGATTREGLLSTPFRSRFGIRERLDLYTTEEIIAILRRSSLLIGIECTDDGLSEIAKRSRGTARIANSYLRRIRDVAQVRHNGIITEDVAVEGMGMLGVDSAGLCEIDRRILACLAIHGRPVGLKTIAVTVGEDEITIEEAYEPWLIQQAFIAKTPAGRTLVPSGLDHCLKTGIVTVEQLARPMRPSDFTPPPISAS